MYVLVNISGEVIDKRRANSFDDAITLFSVIKNLTPERLLSIYKVIKIN